MGSTTLPKFDDTRKWTNKKPNGLKRKPYLRKDNFPSSRNQTVTSKSPQRQGIRRQFSNSSASSLEHKKVRHSLSTSDPAELDGRQEAEDEMEDDLEDNDHDESI